MSSTLNRPVPLNILTLARSCVAATAVFMPRVGARIFRLDADGTPAIVMGRMFGIRNGVLAAGLMRLDTITSPRTFIRINVLVDLLDALSFVAAGRRREIGTAATVLGTGVALTAAGLGAAAAVSLPDDAG
jgi:hypothetical protein